MLDLLAAAAVMLVLVAVVALALIGVSVVPFVLATDLAEKKRFSTSRAGGAALAGVLVGLAGALLLTLTDLPSVLLVLPLLLCWAVPLVLWLLPEGEGALVGRQGHHEQ